MVDNKRIDEIDWLRGFAAFLVVLGHAIIVFPVNLHDILWCRYLYNVIYSFHMPMFFAISGYCYSIGGGYYSYLIKKVKRLLIPYFVFAFGGVIPRLLLPGLVNGSETIGESIINILFHGGEYWFLYTLFIILALFPLIVRQMNRNSMVSLLGVIGLGILGSIIPNFLCIQQVLYFMVFFFIGYLAKKKRILERGKERVQKLSRTTKFSIVLASVSVVSFSGYVHGKYDFIVLNLIEAVLGIVACVIIVLCFPVLLRKFGRYSKYSLSLYLLNGYWLVLSRTLAVNILGVDNPICIIAFNVVIDFYISYLVVKYILSKLPIIRAILGIV